MLINIVINNKEILRTTSMLVSEIANTVMFKGIISRSFIFLNFQCVL